MKPTTDPLDEGLKEHRGLKLGCLVHGSHSPSFDLLKAGAVGLLVEIMHTEGPTLYCVGRTKSDSYGYFEHIRRITIKEAGDILRGARELRMERGMPNKPTMGDEIRAFLREEARQKRILTPPPSPPPQSSPSPASP